MENKKVMYRKIISGYATGEIFAVFPKCSGNCLEGIDADGIECSFTIELFENRMTDATAKESTMIRKILENKGYSLEQISYEEFKEIAFRKNTYYRLPLDTYGQTTGQIEEIELTEAEYLRRKKYELENLTAIWFDNYRSAFHRVEN